MPFIYVYESRSYVHARMYASYNTIDERALSECAFEFERV